MCCGTGVQAVVALFEIADDALAVFDGLESSYLNLASTRSTASRRPRIPANIRPYGCFGCCHWGVAAFGLEVAELSGEDLYLSSGSSTMVGRQTNWTAE